MAVDLKLRWAVNERFTSCIDLLSGEKFAAGPKLAELVRGKVHLGFVADEHLRDESFSGRYMARLLHERAAHLRAHAAQLDRLAGELRKLPAEALPSAADDGEHEQELVEEINHERQSSDDA